MAILLNCPNCQRQLRAPDELLGRAVKCPSCQTQFTAEVQAAPPRQDFTSAAPRPSAPVGPSQGAAPAWSEPQGPDDFGAMDAQRSYRSAAAASAVYAPAMTLMILSGLAVGLSALSLVLNLAMGGILAAQGGGGGGGNPQLGGGADPMVNMVSGVVGATFGLFYYGIVFAGAMQMYQTRNWGFALASSIMALMPCSLCCCFTLPIGIWSIVVLAQEDVKRGFR